MESSREQVKNPKTIPAMKRSYILVLAVEVNHSPATPTTSRPEDSWLKKRGWPGRQRQNLNTFNQLLFETLHERDEMKLPKILLSGVSSAV